MSLQMVQYTYSKLAYDYVIRCQCLGFSVSPFAKHSSDLLTTDRSGTGNGEVVPAGEHVQWIIAAVWEAGGIGQCLLTRPYAASGQ